MSAQSFLEDFGYLANAPNGIAKLREMILCLAMLGKLTDQRSDDVPANVLMVKVAEKKQRQIDDKKSKKSKPALKIQTNEIPHPIPDNWVWVRFGDIAQHNAGKTLDQRRNTGHPRDYITTSNLYWGRFELGELRQMLIRDEELDRCTAKKGDLLICEGGEAGRAAVWSHDHEVSFQNHVHRARFYADINPYFAYRFLEKLNATGEINNYRKGVGISNMSGKALASIVFPLPPLEEQKRIVAKVDELMALCNKLEAQQQERDRLFPVLSRAAHTRFTESPVPDNFKAIFDETGSVSTEDLLRTIIGLATEGKLTKRKPDMEPVGEILDGLDKSGGNLQIRRSVPVAIVRPPADFSNRFPQTWALVATARLIRSGAFRDVKDGNHGANHPKVNEFTPEGLPFITASQISEQGLIDYEGAYKLSGKALARLRVGFAEIGDVIYTHKGSIGRVAVCTQPCILSPQTTYYRPAKEVINNEFLRLCLLSPFFRDQVDKVKKQTTRDFVPIKAQFEFFIPVPPLAEQLEIVEVVGKLMPLIQKYQQQQAQQAKVATAYAQATVAAITGTQIKDTIPMKAPKTELITNLETSVRPKASEAAPLATLIVNHKGSITAKVLWQQSGLEIDAFYQQLKTEMANGWIVESEEAFMKAVEAG
ncbi:MAG: restriction endonuclease subunit S [Candidatus Thiodiazotropha sp. (ex Lucinoma borealis)]|nr:restriction endonuclease subunit S [Candidatus Thiodiazotropha sp. (ex Lucinoma borealis)]